MIRRLLTAGLLAGVLLAGSGGAALAQQQIRIVPKSGAPAPKAGAVDPAGGRAPTAAPAARPTPVRPPPARGPSAGELHVVGVAPSTFVTVKDHGDSHTVMVFVVRSDGKLQQTAKARFFY